MSCFPFSATTFDRLRGKQHHNTTSSPAGGPDPPPRHVLPAAAASVPPESTAITRRLLSPPHPRSPLRVRRRQILSPPHLRASPSPHLSLSSLSPLTPLPALPAPVSSRSRNFLVQDNEIRQKKEACYTDVEKYVLRSCALCCFLFGGTHLTRCFCVLTAVSRLVRSGLWGGGCADPRQRRRRTACCAASPRSATT